MNTAQAFKPPLTPFAKLCIAVGQAVEAKDWELTGEHYVQGCQALRFKRGRDRLTVTVEEE